MNYRSIHFRLESGYKWGEGMEEDRTNDFYDDITNLFKNGGWTIKEKRSSSSCPVVTKDKNRLYLHPMDASGELQEDLISEVEEILSKGKTFTHYNTDIYEILHDMSDEEYQIYLEENRNNIESDILNAFKTKRKNLYIVQSHAVIDNIKEKYRIQRIQEHICRSSNNIEWQYVADIFLKLINDNKIIVAKTKSGEGYRTAA